MKSNFQLTCPTKIEFHEKGEKTIPSFPDDYYCVANVGSCALIPAQRVFLSSESAKKWMDASAANLGGFSERNGIRIRDSRLNSPTHSFIKWLFWKLNSQHRRETRRVKEKRNTHQRRRRTDERDPIIRLLGGAKREESFRVFHNAQEEKEGK